MDQGINPISEELAADIVRAAPTHDLGKLTNDNSILNKPGRLTDEEFAIMCENMGTQFDPNMKSVFLGCREQLEQYYTENDR